ncbi:MAG: hypothetical protein WBA91_08210, partial [Paracoccaceae bacterium]
MRETKVIFNPDGISVGPPVTTRARDCQVEFGPLLRILGGNSPRAERGAERSAQKKKGPVKALSHLFLLPVGRADFLIDGDARA